MMKKIREGEEGGVRRGYAFPAYKKKTRFVHMQKKVLQRGKARGKRASRRDAA